MRHLILPLSMLVVLSAPALGDTYVVNPEGTGDFPVIQAAINTVAPGDTIELANGIFTGDGNRDLDYHGLAITIRSQSGNPDSCIIDCEGSETDFHRGFNFHFDEDSTSVLEGVWIRNGFASIGGAIYLTWASPTISNCKFTNNSADTHGGAIYSAGQSYSTFADCIFSGNWAAQYGGGICCYSYSTQTYTRCTISDNSSDNYGGGMYLGGYATQLTDCTLSGNSAGLEGGAIYGYHSDFIMSSCSIFGNSAVDHGGGIYCGITSNPQITNCTIFDNSALQGAGLSILDESYPVIENTIIAYGGTGEAVYCDYTSWPTLACCDVYGNAGGDWVGCITSQIGIDGNISEDPVFCDPDNEDFTLRGDSPCAPLNNEECGLIGAFGVGCGAPLFADFVGDPTSGDAPLAVQFTDLTTGGPPLAWEWDFENDGPVDDTSQNPLFEYQDPGIYSVTLTAYSIDSTSTITKTNYITVNTPPIFADFSADLTVGEAPLEVQFTDLTVGDPIAWEWDFQNDEEVDDTFQNPAFVYETPGLYSVKLTAFSPWDSSSITKIDYIQVLGANYMAIQSSSITPSQPDPIPVTFGGSDSLGALSIYIDFDSTVVTFEGIETYVDGESFSGGIVGGQISVQWFDETGGDDPIIPGADPDTLFAILLSSTLCSDTTQLVFDESQCMLGDREGNPIPGIQWVDEPPYGRVTISRSTSTMAIYTVELDTPSPAPVPVYLDGSDSLGAMSLFFDFDSTKLNFEGLESYVPDEVFSGGIVGGQISVQWFDETGGEDPIIPGVDSDSLFGILFTANTNVDTTQVTFDEVQSMLGDIVGNPLPCVIWLDDPPFGAVVINMPADVSGRVGYYSGDLPVARAILGMGPPHSEVESDSLGNYEFQHPPENCVLHISKLTDVGGINSLDAIKVIRHAIGEEPFDDPYELLAADVNVDDFINALDAIKIVRAAVGVEDLISGDWAFNPDSVLFEPLMGDTIQDFIAVRMGDVNGDWEPDEGRGRLAGTSEAIREIITLAFPDSTVDMEASSVQMPLLVNEFNDIGAISLRVTFAETVLQYSSVISMVDGVTFITNLVGNEIRIEWYDATGGENPISIGSDTLLAVEYELIGEPGESSPIHFTNACMIGDAIGNPIEDSVYIDGSCTIEDDGTNVADSTVPIFQLRQNYPNPFNPKTEIPFNLPEDLIVNLRLYDLAGRCVRELVSNMEYPAGIHRLIWDGMDSTGKPLSSGVGSSGFRVGGALS